MRAKKAAPRRVPIDAYIDPAPLAVATLGTEPDADAAVLALEPAGPVALEPESEPEPAGTVTKVVCPLTVEVRVTCVVDATAA